MGYAIESIMVKTIVPGPGWPLNGRSQKNTCGTFSENIPLQGVVILPIGARVVRGYHTGSIPCISERTVVNDQPSVS